MLKKAKEILTSCVWILMPLFDKDCNSNLQYYLLIPLKMHTSKYKYELIFVSQILPNKIIYIFTKTMSIHTLSRQPHCQPQPHHNTLNKHPSLQKTYKYRVTTQAYALSSNQLDINLLIHLQNQPQSPKNTTLNKNRQTSNGRSSQIAESLFQENICNICQKTIPKSLMNQHYFQHKLGSSKNNLKSTQITDRFNSTITKTQRKNYNPKNINTISQYGYPNQKQIQEHHPKFRTTDYSLDQLINNIKLQNYVKKYTLPQTNYNLQTQNILHQNLDFGTGKRPSSKKIQYQLERRSNSKKKIQILQQSTGVSRVNCFGNNLHDINSNELSNQPKTLNSRASSKRKLSLTKNIQKQMFFLKQSVSQSKQYKFERQSSNRKTQNSCTKSKVPLNILAQQYLLTDQ